MVQGPRSPARVHSPAGKPASKQASLTPAQKLGGDSLQKEGTCSLTGFNNKKGTGLLSGSRRCGALTFAHPVISCAVVYTFQVGWDVLRHCGLGKERIDHDVDAKSHYQNDDGYCCGYCSIKHVELQLLRSLNVRKGSLLTSFVGFDSLCYRLSHMWNLILFGCLTR